MIKGQKSKKKIDKNFMKVPNIYIMVDIMCIVLCNALPVADNTQPHLTLIQL